MPLTDIVCGARLSEFGRYSVSDENIMRNWRFINFKASINRAKNGTLPLNDRDTTAVRTEWFFALIIGQI
ncbi:hypothetical protein [Rhizobium sp. BK008]|uniref:hypothetical protein n=1 Tax=Rhizobium sp. BK008 TaxID=2587094 RepID=UPI0016149611|nr:hypothetical protein [Rhizobium sp. BK008]MBB4249374.1 hypothetical protein [Rhizobium sp. BK008]